MISSTSIESRPPDQAGAAEEPEPLSPPVPRLDRDQLSTFASVLRAAGYDGAQDLALPDRPAPLEESEGRLAVLRKLFWRGSAMLESEARDALAPASLD